MAKMWLVLSLDRCIVFLSVVCTWFNSLFNYECNKVDKASMLFSGIHFSQSSLFVQWSNCLCRLGIFMLKTFIWYLIHLLDFKNICMGIGCTLEHEFIYNRRQCLLLQLTRPTRHKWYIHWTYVFFTLCVIQFNAHAFCISRSTLISSRVDHFVLCILSYPLTCNCFVFCYTLISMLKLD